jgi:stage II sporulation protein D
VPRGMSSGMCALLLLSALAQRASLSAQEPPATDPIEQAFVALQEDVGPSHASGARPELGPVVIGNPTQAVTTLRVGLYMSTVSGTGALTEFATLHHTLVRISNTDGAVQVIDRSGGVPVTTLQPGEVAEVSWTGTAYAVSLAGTALGTYPGPMLFKPASPENLFRVESLLRANILGGPAVVPLYRGALEVARGTATQAGRVNLVNIVALESYVPGVVANESPASFHVEALKAQATAARGYAVANIGNWVARGYPFDIVDSSSSQVYRGVVSEHPRAVEASTQTRGLVASYAGRIISALYSSSMGGHTEDNEWIFPSPSTSLPGANATPYLRGIYDGAGVPPDVADPVQLAAFWTSQQADTYDSCAQVNNRFSRWRIVIPAATIKLRLPGRYVIADGDPATVLTGDIIDVQVVARMAASGRIAVARVVLTSGAVDVRGWDNLRFVLGRTAVSTPLDCGSAAAANFTLNNPSLIEPVLNGDGTLREVVAAGGGWGHNVGLSQFGAHGRGRAGQTFIPILKAYYTGVDIGSYPIDIGRQPGSGPPTLRQEFNAPSGRGVLEIRSSSPLKGLVVHVNELYDLVLTQASLAAPVVRIDLTPYLLTGANVVQYNPVGSGGSATVTVIVE